MLEGGLSSAGVYILQRLHGFGHSISGMQKFSPRLGSPPDSNRRPWSVELPRVVGPRVKETSYLSSAPQSTRDMQTSWRVGRASFSVKSYLYFRLTSVILRFIETCK